MKHGLNTDNKKKEEHGSALICDNRLVSICVPLLYPCSIRGSSLLFLRAVISVEDVRDSPDQKNERDRDQQDAKQSFTHGGHFLFCGKRSEGPVSARAFSHKWGPLAIGQQLEGHFDLGARACV